MVGNRTQVRPDKLENRQGRMPYGFIELVANRDLRSLQRRLARSKESEFSALITEERHDDRMLCEEILLKLHLCVGVETKHRDVECKHIVLGDLRFRRRRTTANDHIHVIWQILSYG